MKKVTVFVGSARKKFTHYAASRFLDNLRSLGEVEGEIVSLSDYRIGTCRGCKVCFEKGEEFCPLKDDRDVLIGKMMASDGVVFASPNYMFQVSGFMKVFLDRLGFFGHRPQFFGKAFTSIVVQGFFGGGKILKYLDLIGSCLGFNTVKGCSVTALEPMKEKEKQRIERAIAKHSRRFYENLLKPAFPVPPLIMLMGFRMGRMAVRLELTEKDRDYQYYKEKGWFESDYFYPVRLGPLKKLAGRLFDWIGARKSRNR